MIGMFDSGLGGLSVLRAVRELLPGHNTLYLADSAYCPYGPRPLAEVRDRALACSRWLVGQGAQLVVVACNTATSAAIELLRDELAVPVVGTEPGVKPAAAATRSGHVGVLATSSTLGGERLATLVERFAGGLTVHTLAAPGLVDLVERGELAGPRARTLVAAYLAPLLSAGCDVIVLGCTHFPFLRPLIAELAGPTVTIIDTGPAVAAQVARLAAELPSGAGGLHMATTGKPSLVAGSVAAVWGAALAVERAGC
jgi:glutamate racemase